MEGQLAASEATATAADVALKANIGGLCQAYGPE